MFGNSSSNNNIFQNLNSNNNNNIFGTKQSSNPFLNIDKSSNPFSILNGNNNQQNNNIFQNINNNNYNKGNISFGVNNNSQNTNIFINKNAQQNQNNIMGNNINNINNGQFNNNNNNGGLFLNNNNQTNLINNNINDNNVPISNISFMTTITPIIALNEQNELKNLLYDKFPKEFQNAFLNLKINLNNQQAKLDELKRYSQRLTKLLEQNYKSVEKLGKLSNSINEKINKYENKLNQINDNYDLILESFEEENKKIRIMEQNPGLKIEIPSKFLLEYSQNLLNRTELYKKKLDDIITLIRVSCSQNNNNFECECDIMESTLAEFIKMIRFLLEANSRQEKAVNELLQILLKFAVDYGENPEEIYNNVMQYAFEYSNNSV